MIGNYIKGTDIAGAACEGVILDKVLCLQTISIPPPPGQLGGRAQVMPIPLDAYLVRCIGDGSLDDVKLHLVNPGYISEITLINSRRESLRRGR